MDPEDLGLALQDGDVQLLGLRAWVSPVFYGGVLVVAVTLATLLRRRTA